MEQGGEPSGFAGGEPRGLGGNGEGFRAGRFFQMGRGTAANHPALPVVSRGVWGETARASEPVVFSRWEEVQRRTIRLCRW